MRSRLLLVMPALLSSALLASFPTTAHAQETFGSGSEPEPSAAAPEAAPVAPPAPVAADEWWRAKPAALPLPPPRTPKPLALRFDGAYAPRRLFALGVTGADMGFGLGVQTAHHVAWWWATRLSLGSTENSLSVWSGRSGVEVEAVYDPIRFGVGASLMWMGVDRAVRDQTLQSYGVEARAFARFDCWRTDDVALFLRAAIDGAVEARSGSAFWGPALGAGLELGVRGKRKPEWSATAPPIPRL